MSSSKEKSVESTDIMARQVGDYERVELVGAIGSSLDGIYCEEVQKISNPTNCEVALLEFECIDGEVFIARPMTQFITYNNQSQVIEEIYDQGYAYANIGEEYCTITPTEEDVRYVSKNQVTNSSYTIRSFLQKMQVKYGERDIVSCDRDSSRAVKCLKLPELNIADRDLDQYLNFISDLSYRPTKSTVVEVIDPSKLRILIRGSCYTLWFNGRPTTDDHVPTKLAEEIGVRTPENLEGEDVYVGSGRYEYHASKMNVVGRNLSKTVAIGY